VLCAKLADDIKANLLAGNFDNLNEIRIVVVTNAAASTESDEGMGNYSNWSLGGSGWGDNAHCHNLWSLWNEISADGGPDHYPLYWKQLIDDGIVDKAWSTEAGTVLFFDFEMVGRYGFAEFDCE